MTEPEPTTSSRGARTWAPASLLTAESGAIAALTVALVSLSGQNLLVIGLQALLGQGFNDRSVGPTGFYVSWGLSTAVVVAVTVLLARPAVVQPSGWATHVAKAAVLLALLVAFGGLLLVLGGLV